MKIVLKYILSAFLLFIYIDNVYPKDNNIYGDTAYRIEMQRLEIERSKVNQQWITSGLTVATIIITAIVAYLTFKTNNRNLEISRRNAEDASRIQSKLKAVDVVISAASPKTAAQRIRLVNQILGEELIKESELEIIGVGQGHDGNRKELIGMIIENFDKRREVIDLWKISFGEGGLKNDISKIEKYLFP